MQQPKNKNKLHERAPSNNKNESGVVELSVLVAELFSGAIPLSVSKTFRSYPAPLKTTRTVPEQQE